MITKICYVAVCQCHGDILDAVSRPCSVGIPAEPLYGFPGSLHFNTHAVALGQITGDGFANLVYLARQHELILIFHPVEISTSCKSLALILIAHLQVVQTLGLRHLQIGIDVILEVVSCGFFVSNGIRHVGSVVRGDVVSQTELGIERLKALVHVIDNTLVGVPVDFVCRTIHLDIHIAILQVNIGIQSLQEFVVHLAINVPVGLLCIVVIILVVG